MQFQDGLQVRMFVADGLEALAFDPLAANIRFRPLLQSRVHCVHLLPLPI